MDCKAFCLLTDFGQDDAYVGQMKCVLLSLAPGAPIIDLSHGLRPHNVLQAGFFLSASWPYLPRGSVCLAVVDPGVGSARDILILSKQDRFVLAPDNGLLGQVLRQPGGNRLFRLTFEPEGRSRSSTFHGRDIFAPAAAELFRGARPEDLGQAVEPSRIVALELTVPEIAPGSIRTSIGHVDRFGNCLLNLPVSLWDGGLASLDRLHLVEPQERLVRPAGTYAGIESGALGLVPGSQGVLELAVNQGSCASELGLDIGDSCRFQGDFGPLA